MLQPRSSETKNVNVESFCKYHQPSPTFSNGDMTSTKCAPSALDVVNRQSPMSNSNPTSGINQALLHPQEFSSNILHNFAPVYAPKSSIAKTTGYAWWAIGGIDGHSAANRYLVGVYLLKSIDGLKWMYAHDRKPIFSENDVRYHKFYHSAFDGQNRIVYDDVLDIFFFFTRANVGRDARSWQRSMSRDMVCFSNLIPVQMLFFNDWCGNVVNGKKGEQFYTHSTFQLPKMYPGVMFAVPRRSGGSMGGSSSLMHSYDHGASWRRTSGFNPFMAPSAEDMKSFGVLAEYVLAPFGARYNNVHNSIDYYNMRSRKNVEVWRAPLLGSVRADVYGGERILPRVAGVKIPIPILKESKTTTTFETYPIMYHSQCVLHIDYEGAMPSVAILQTSGGSAVLGYESESSSISNKDGKITWSQKNTVQRRQRLPSKEQTNSGGGYILKFTGSGYTLFGLHCMSSVTHYQKKMAEQYAQDLLANKVVHINISTDFYRVSHDQFLESKTQQVFHPFWYGRKQQAVYFLDTEMINAATIQGDILVQHLLARPSSGETVFEGSHKEHAIYPHLVDILADKDINDKKCNVPGRQQAHGLWLFQNKYPAKYLSGAGDDHKHDFYNFVTLHIATAPLGNGSKWMVPREVADKDYGFFCPDKRWVCILSLQTFRTSGSWNVRTSWFFMQMYLWGGFLYVALIPHSVYSVCFACSRNMECGTKVSYLVFAVKMNFFIACLIMASNLLIERCENCGMVRN